MPYACFHFGENPQNAGLAPQITSPGPMAHAPFHPHLLQLAPRRIRAGTSFVIHCYQTGFRQGHACAQERFTKESGISIIHENVQNDAVF